MAGKKASGKKAVLTAATVMKAGVSTARASAATVAAAAAHMVVSTGASAGAEAGETAPAAAPVGETTAAGRGPQRTFPASKRWVPCCRCCKKILRGTARTLRRSPSRLGGRTCLRGMAARPTPRMGSSGRGRTRCTPSPPPKLDTCRDRIARTARVRWLPQRSRRRRALAKRSPWRTRVRLGRRRTRSPLEAPSGCRTCRRHTAAGPPRRAE